MSGFSKRDTVTYRRDEKFGHKLLTPEERLKLVKPYLPSPRTRSPAKDNTTAEERRSHFGVRRLLRQYLYALCFAIIHGVFSLYIRLRNAYHAVIYRVYSVAFYHHRTPELIQRDLKGLSKLPEHLSVILTLDESRRGGDELEKLVNEVAEIAAWCASAGIATLSIYEKTGILKIYLSETHRALSQKLAVYFGPHFPVLTLSAAHLPTITSPASPRAGQSDESEAKTLSVILLSADDGRESVVDLTKTLTEMAQRGKISPADVSVDLVDAELKEIVMTEPDLLVLFGPYVELAGYPPWQVRLCEIFHLPDNHGVGYQVFYRALCNYAKAEFRLGR